MKRNLIIAVLFGIAGVIGGRLTAPTSPKYTPSAFLVFFNTFDAGGAVYIQPQFNAKAKIVFPAIHNTTNMFAIGVTEIEGVTNIEDTVHGPPPPYPFEFIDKKDTNLVSNLNKLAQNAGKWEKRGDPIAAMFGRIDGPEYILTNVTGRGYQWITRPQ